MFILLSDVDCQNIDIYEFKNNEFIYVKAAHNLIGDDIV